MKRALPGKKLVITLLVLIGLLVAADFGAAAVAENQVSKKMGDKLGLAKDPEVRINGFPFLTQAIRGDFRDVQLRAPGVDMGPVEDVGLQADLHHARVSTFAMLRGNSSRIDVDEVVGRVRLDDSSLGKVLPVNDLHISPAGDSAGPTADSTSTGVRMEGTVDIAGSTNKVAVTGRLVLNDEGGIRIEPRELDLDNSKVGSVDLASRFEQAILRRFTTTLDPGMLPFTVRPTALHVERGALVAEGTARDVTINGDGTVN
ncbi:MULTISPECIES: LmeA family phospholipid-binding protein [Actinopolyspora]|uniref:DUF2993 domain-containing protein n=1 Tax=Actinopolyspora saharensis TaxID=995062 RepID=A0A1H1G6X0_9ACTN|nr:MULTISPECIES: DUF2993 domain-containing protein [Actinopolyspora]NHD16374.1 DUF2993 domain-containing protein [Actinopolyspora sp. BKK2]NHE75763.1 DUF2993 domain-containing protein [Actinopolyspora sp. BKK1]SDR08566.1 Protein of unknown function [Actinopolyspora saharensis]